MPIYIESAPPATSRPPLQRTLSIAPMLAWTDRHYRYVMRLITRHTLLYTEMITTGALLHGDRDRLLQFDSCEHPVALQLAGADPAALAQCAQYGADCGYDEINLNVGCPSPRVQHGRFGACLIAEPALVADCIAAMKAVVSIPVTIKTRLGLNTHTPRYDDLVQFTAQQIAAGCDALIIHARTVWLNGMSPRANRARPPLQYEYVAQLKREFPQLPIVLNGGIDNWETVHTWLPAVDGVMIGQAAYRNPWLFATADAQLFNDVPPSRTPHDVITALLPYVECCMAAGVPFNSIARHLHGLFQGHAGARAWRRYLTTHANTPAASIDVLIAAAALVSTAELHPEQTSCTGSD